MAKTIYRDSLYSFRVNTALIANVANNGPDAATLAQIESYLSTAAQDFYQRRYADSIDSYQSAAVLIYAYLDPHFVPFSSAQFAAISKDARLFDTLLSVGARYLDVLPIPSPQPLTPPVAADPNLLGTSPLVKIGVRSAALTTAAQLTAAADMQAAANFRALGMPTLAGQLETQATKSDARIAGIFRTAVLDGGATAPATAAGMPSGSASAATASAGAATPSASAATSRADLPKLAAVKPATVTVAKFANLPTSLPSSILEGRSLTLATLKLQTTLNWAAGASPDVAAIKKAVYASRIGANLLDGDVLLHPVQPADVAVSLPHYYYYTIPLGIAEDYYAMGDYQSAEAQYFVAASYPYLNQTSEVPYLFRRLACLYRDWGTSYFQNGDAQSAAPIYQNVILFDGTVPTSKLFTTANLKAAADVGRQIAGDITNAAALQALTTTVNPDLIAAFVQCYAELQKINGGLDFWGLHTNTVPIWTFDYLQSVAINFAQLAMSAEQDFITFQDNADQGSLTQTQLTQNLKQSVAEQSAAQAQADAANAQVTVYNDGVNLANTRVANAQANATDYANDSWYQNLYQASAAQIQGGDDGDPDYLNQLASQLMGGSSISDDQATVGAATSLAASMYSRDYEIGCLNRTVTEMQAAAQQAQDDLTAARANAAAAQAQVTAASVRVTGAQAMITQFDSSYFTPDVWAAMAQTAYQLYQRYFNMAIKVARLMQQAYNFETDQALAWIKNSYSSDTVKGLLGAQALMADIQQFTYDLVTSTQSKPQPLRQTISLAANYPFLFQSQFRTTGIMAFETRVDDFDALYPGIYAGRIESVEVAVQGIVPVRGLSGTLTNAGISTYRVPSAAWPVDGSAPPVKYRVQPRETLVLSDYTVRDDSLLFTQNNNMLRIFQGAGTASTWQLEIPRAINDIDYGSILDVQITFYYKARYDDTLKARVLAYMANLPGVTTKSLSLPLRWLYPDAFYAFGTSGSCTFTLRARDFPRNQTTPLISDIGVLIATDGSVPASDITLSLTTPAKAAVKVTTDATGMVDSETIAALGPLLGGTAVGDYVITMTAADNPALTNAGKLDLSPVLNIAVLLKYTFTPRA